MLTSGEWIKHILFRVVWQKRTSLYVTLHFWTAGMHLSGLHGMQISVYVCVHVVCIFCECVRACQQVPGWRCVMSAFLLFLYLTVNMCVCRWHFWMEELYTPTQSSFNTHCLLHTSTHTQTYITHPFADTHVSPRQPKTAKDLILTEEQRPPYWQARGWRCGGY